MVAPSAEEKTQMRAQFARPMRLSSQASRSGCTSVKIFATLAFVIATLTVGLAQTPSPASFTSASLIDTGFEGLNHGGNAMALATADFNGDGTPDIIAIGTASQPPVYETFSGNGNGTFSSSGSTTLFVRNSGDGINAHNPDIIAIGDFNHDGKLDFAVYINGGQSGANYLDVYLGDGTGHFSFSNNHTIGNIGSPG